MAIGSPPRRPSRLPGSGRRGGGAAAMGPGRSDRDLAGRPEPAVLGAQPRRRRVRGPHRSGDAAARPPRAGQPERARPERRVDPLRGRRALDRGLGGPAALPVAVAARDPGWCACPSARNPARSGVHASWRRSQSIAKAATRSSAPGSSKRWVAPCTTASSLGQRSCRWAGRLSSSTCWSAPPTISSVGRGPRGGSRRGRAVRRGRSPRAPGRRARRRR